ncbi:MAG: hypothetical protein HOA17_00715 [Candidatus Melainabacteria bacterium]|nr:hypothetical protein [Candidatus Melainabacteria bacterium]
MFKPLSLFSDQDLAAARAPAPVKAEAAGENDHLNPDGTKKYKQLATDNRPSRSLHEAEKLLAAGDVDNDGIIDELPEPDDGSSTVKYLNKSSKGKKELQAKAKKPPLAESRADWLANTTYDNENLAVDWDLQ